MLIADSPIVICNVVVIQKPIILIDYFARRNIFRVCNYIYIYVPTYKKSCLRIYVSVKVLDYFRMYIQRRAYLCHWLFFILRFFVSIVAYELLKKYVSGNYV